MKYGDKKVMIKIEYRNCVPNTRVLETCTQHTYKQEKHVPGTCLRPKAWIRSKTSFHILTCC